MIPLHHLFYTGVHPIQQDFQLDASSSRLTRWKVTNVLQKMRVLVYIYAERESRHHHRKNAEDSFAGSS